MSSRSLNRKLAPSKAWPVIVSRIASLDLVALAVVDRCREPVLAWGCRLQLLASFSLRTQCELPGIDCCLDRIALGVVGDLQQFERSLAGDRLSIERLRFDSCFNLVARAVMAAIDPGIDREGLAGHQHGPRADDCAA